MFAVFQGVFLRFGLGGGRGVGFIAVVRLVEELCNPWEWWSACCCWGGGCGVWWLSLGCCRWAGEEGVMASMYGDSVDEDEFKAFGCGP